ncbi:metal ABC transporter substrate-binding protein [Zafaria cholistanensis]|uniref:Metal ABC transporter substrate-binding protein n=1 Tax=Zafaria cholistanensis TaxID=1682741 RepID=A0A5A7NT40_9MICC|nr:zinc ABC transporter substrate-binding protein [Zafaria cholistanensis]GER24054.1 metal ABC transporter substrate-binding protein [Zafaria cholistanensis]
MRHFPHRHLLLSLSAAAALALAGCGAGPAADTDADANAGDAGIVVVASTSVYADVVRAVGGDEVDVQALIDKTSQDPHSYEATAQDKLLLSKADLVVANGGGYDPFMEVLAADLKLPEAAVLSAVEYSGEAAHAEEAGEESAEESSPAGDHAHAHSAFNEHVWYDLHAMEAVAGEVAGRLGALRPESSAAFRANAEAFARGLEPAEARIEALAASNAGKRFAMTEPVPYYLLVEAGLEDGTPEGFSEAIEEGGDVPPLLLKELQDGLAGGEYAVLAYNAQTSGPQTEAVRQAAVDAGVPVVDFTETLPEGIDYVSWMNSNVGALEAALAG